MTNAAQRVKTLIQDMAEDRKHYHTLATLLEKQRHHIVARDATALDALNVQIMAQYQLLSQSSQQRYQILNQLLDAPEALAYAPLLVKRLRRLRQRRQESRSARHLTVRANV